MNFAADGDLLPAFERALAEGRLSLAYQPKVELRSGRVKMAEALIRWDDALLGKIPPSRFVPLAEQYGWIDDLTVFGLDTMMKQWGQWKQAGTDLTIAFNISALSLQHLDFPDLVERLLRSTSVPPNRLVLELTEGATQSLVKLMDTLTRFRIKGIGLAIDDFGTGYSSLLQLRQLPFTEVKVDRAFVTDLHESNESRLIVEAIIRLAHGFGLVATAEGVERPEQLAVLTELGCDFAQGYLFCQPLDPADMPAFLESFPARWAQLAE